MSVASMAVVQYLHAVGSYPTKIDLILAKLTAMLKQRFCSSDPSSTLFRSCKGKLLEFQSVCNEQNPTYGNTD